MVKEGARSGSDRAFGAGSDAELLREVCADVLAAGDCPPDLAAWCVRVLVEPGRGERVVTDITRNFDGQQHI